MGTPSADCAIAQSSGRLRPDLARICLMLFGAVLGIGACGCWLAVLPLAINAAEDVGSAVASVTINAVVSAHQESGKFADQDHPGESEMDREDCCEQLQLEVPGVIELRKSAAGAPEYRELQVSGSLGNPQWRAMVDQDARVGGWRPAANFLQMNFTPPLGPLPDAGSDYLAYRLIQSESPAEVEFAPLTVNFGKPKEPFAGMGLYTSSR